MLGCANNLLVSSGVVLHKKHYWVFYLMHAQKDLTLKKPENNKSNTCVQGRHPPKFHSNSVQKLQRSEKQNSNIHQQATVTRTKIGVIHDRCLPACLPACKLPVARLSLYIVSITQLHRLPILGRLCSQKIFLYLFFFFKSLK